MQLELLLSNDLRALPSVRAFARETLHQLAVAVDDATPLEQLIAGAVQAAIEHAYPPGEHGEIRLTVREEQGKLEILIRDYGLPQDLATLEAGLHDPQAVRGLFGCPAAEVADEMHWLAFGPQGKALQIIKWLHDTNILDTGDAQSLAPFQEDAARAPEQQYTVGRMLPEEAVQVSQLMYRAYGNSYFNEDVYYPDRVAAHNAQGSIISSVARDQSGAVAGHCALEVNQPGPVAELGQAVIDPAHRGRGLLDKLKEATVEEAKRLNLVGWYADAVAVHVLTQKSNANHGGHLTAVELGISPKTEVFRGISGEQTQRVTCLLYFHWLQQPTEHAIHVPTRHQEIVAAIYKNLECPIRFGEPVAPQGPGTLAVMLEPSAGRATIRVEQLGADSMHAVFHAKRELVERSGVKAVFVDLPLAQPGTPHVATELEEIGFGFAGIAPHFAQTGDLLRLVYLTRPLAREPIKTFEPFADRLVNYTLVEQTRVREPL